MTAVIPRLGALLPDRELLLADHLGPFASLRPDVVGELVRRTRHRLEHLRRQEFFAELRIGQNLRDLGVDLGHDLARRAGGREQPEPGRGFVVRQTAFGDGRNVGSERQALATADTEDLDLSCAERRQREADADRHQIDVPGDDVGERRRGAADRKRTRLNSSHVRISYAVFCLKKKKKKQLQQQNKKKKKHIQKKKKNKN